MFFLSLWSKVSEQLSNQIVKTWIKQRLPNENFSPYACNFDEISKNEKNGFGGDKKPDLEVGTNSPYNDNVN